MATPISGQTFCSASHPGDMTGIGGCRQFADTIVHGFGLTQQYIFGPSTRPSGSRLMNVPVSMSR